MAGVSLATVDRVLNERPGVRAVTVQRVHKAIEELGYVRNTEAANLARGRVYSLLFILPRSDNEFVSALGAQIAAQTQRLATERTRIRTASAAPFEPQDYVRLLDALTPGETDGVAIFGPETPSIRDAIKRARDRGIAVVALVSDLPTSARDHFVGIDNIAAGRTAARLIGRFTPQPGKILVLTDTPLSREHLERRHGFDSLIGEAFPQHSVLPTIDAQGDPARLPQILARVLAAQKGICGIYASTAIGPGLITYLREADLPARLVTVSHELTPLSQAALTDGTIDAVISQNAGHLIRSATRLLRATADKAPFNETQERIRIDIYLADNLPPPGP